MSDSAHNPDNHLVLMREWHQLRSELMWIYDRKVSLHHLHDSRYVPGQTAFLLRSGEVEVTVEDNPPLTVKAGQWIFLNERRRQHRFTPGSRILSMHFRLNWPGGRPLFDWGNGTIISTSSASELEAASGKLCQWVTEKLPADGLKLRSTALDIQTYSGIQQLFWSWVHTCCHYFSDRIRIPRSLSFSDPRVQQMLHWLDHYPMQHPFLTEQIAKSVGLSVNQLTRLFTSSLQITPRQYLDNRRLDEAILRLQSGKHPIKRIAFELGFNSASHFSAWFYRKTARTPSQMLPSA